MANPRLISIVAQDLNNDYHKKEAELEEVINNTNIGVEDRVEEIKKVLSEMSVTSRNIEIWNDMLKKMSTDNTEKE